VHLRRLEHDHDHTDAARGIEFREEDFAELQAGRNGQS
jgi:acetyl-CoA synthetase